ncbi:sterol desaturase family protein [Persicobacter psychrovividus]|uniref:Fatty acid hydroxylase n=1 Tax=Persicobacter psychrovividus TaxID=387638 RepID=A0ABM7VA79_9BACT|nr:fatty acid hydroxylase [Persicobacter psychrovividus]
MKKSTTQQKGSPPLFKNQLLEKFTHTHIAYPLLIFYGGGLGLLAYGGVMMGISVINLLVTFTLGLLLFTFVEYWAHRKVYHMIEDKPWKARFTYTFHGVHHDHPKDKSRLAMPPVVSVLIIALLFGLFRLLIGDYAYGFLAGFIAGYATYLFVHYIVHAWRPPQNVFKLLWVHHAIHHYKDNTVAFGVSSPIWDVIFGTMPRKKRT